MANYYPLFLDLDKSSCLMVGGGEVAARKIRSLIEAGAEVTLVSPELAAETRELKQREEIIHLQRGYSSRDIEGHDLVIAATSSRSTNRRVYEDARENNILVNVVDDRELSNFIVPARVNRSPLQLAVCTDGASPALSATIRKNLQEEYGSGFTRYLELLDDLRSAIKNRLPPERRRQLFLDLGGEKIHDLLKDDRYEEVLREVRDLLSEEPEIELKDLEGLEGNEEIS